MSFFGVVVKTASVWFGKEYGSFEKFGMNLVTQCGMFRVVSVAYFRNDARHVLREWKVPSCGSDFIEKCGVIVSGHKSSIELLCGVELVLRECHTHRLKGA